MKAKYSFFLKIEFFTQKTAFFTSGNASQGDRTIDFVTGI